MRLKTLIPSLMVLLSISLSGNNSYNSVAKILFETNQQFWKYNSPAIHFSGQSEDVLHGTAFTDSFNIFSIEGDHNIVLPAGLIYNLSLRDRPELMRQYFEDYKTAANVQGTIGLGFRIGNYDNNFIRLESYGERFGLTNFSRGLDFSSALGSNYLQFFANNQDENLSTIVENSAYGTKSRTQTDNINSIVDKGFSLFVKQPGSFIRFGFTYSQATKTSLQAQTTEIWSSKYRVVPIEGVKTTEQTNTFGQDWQIAIPTSGISTKFSAIYIENIINVLERENVEISDSSYTNVWAQSFYSYNENLLSGVELNYQNNGLRAVINYEPQVNKTYLNMMVYNALIKKNFASAIFVSYNEYNELFGGCLEFVVNPNKRKIEMIIDDGYYRFNKLMIGQYTQVDRIKNLGRDKFEDHILDPAFDSGESSTTFMLSVVSNDVPGVVDVIQDFRMTYIDMAVYFNYKMLFAGFAGQSIEKPGFSSQNIEAQIALKIARSYLAMGVANNWTYSSDNKMNKIIFVKGGFYFNNEH
jgi:hypothetical protein